MKIVVANQKNYLNKKETLNFLKNLRKSSWKNDIIFCPSMVFISLCKSSDLVIGSQYVSVRSPFSSGVSVEQLSDLGVKYCIVGHSDNRNYQNETDRDIFEKVKLLLKSDIIPIFCFGETEKPVSESGLIASIREQVLLVEGSLSKEEIEKVIFAYEPFYNINNSKNSNASLDIDKIKIVLDYFKESLENKYETKIKLLYGGNANPNNVGALNEIESLDGYLVGRNSSNYESLEKMINIINNS